MLKLLLIFIIAIPLVLFFYSLSDTAIVASEISPSHYDIIRIKKILKQHDPRRIKQGRSGFVHITVQDINALLVTSLSALKKARVQTRLHEAKAVIDLSLKLPDNSYALFVNLSLRVKNTTQGSLQIDSMNFGSLSVPGWLLQPGWNLLHQFFYRYPEYQRISNALHMIRIDRDKVFLSYTADWEVLEKLKKKGKEFLLSESERNRIVLYQKKLFQINQQLIRKHAMANQYRRSVNLTDIMQGLFQFALKRSSQTNKMTQQSLRQNSAIEENKALLFVLAMQAAGKNINDILGHSDQLKSTAPYVKTNFLLRNRKDLMQHFIISAFLSAHVSNDLAHATGLFKEVSDSRGGSGFSFADLAADRAGVEFGTMAVGSESLAYYLQLKMSQTISEDDYMPEIDNLPEGLQEASFKRQYGDTESLRYKTMQNELDRRISLCQIYQKRLVDSL